MGKSMRTPSEAVAGFVSGLVMLAYGYFVYTYAVNLPQEDDLPALVAFALRFRPEQASNWLALLQRHNEHVVAWARLAAWGCTRLGLGTWMILGLVWAGQIWIFQLNTDLDLVRRKSLGKDSSAWLGVPVVCLLFSPQYQVTSLWALGLWSNVLVLALALGSFRSLGKRHYLMASAAALAATLANGNGILVFAVGLVLLALQRAKAWVWVLWLAVGGIAYFALTFALMAEDAPGTQTFEILAPAQVPLSVLAFLGSALALVGGAVDGIATLAGGTVVLMIGVYYAFKTIQAVRAEKPVPSAAIVLLGVLGFVVASGLAVALFRSEKGLDVVAGARYRHYGCLALVVAYLMLQERLPERLRLRVAYGASVACLLMLALAYPRQAGYRLPFVWRLQADAYNLAYNRNFPQLIVSGFDSTYAEAVEAGVLAAPPQLGLRMGFPKATSRTYVVDNKGSDHYICRTRYRIESADFRPGAFNDSSSFGVLIRVPAGDTLLFPAEGSRSIPAWVMRKSEVYRPGAKASLFTCGLRGRYAVGWARGKTYFPTGDTVTVE